MRIDVLYDVIVILFIIINLSLNDIKYLDIGMQFILILATSIIYLRNKSFSIIQFKFVSWSILFTILLFTSCAWALPENLTIITTSVAFIQSSILTFCLLCYVRTRDKIKNCMYSFIAAACIIILRFVLEFFLLGYAINTRFILEEGIFAANNTAMVLAYAAFFLFYFNSIREYDNKYYKIYSLILMISFLFCSFLMGTKKALFIFLIGVILLNLYKIKNIFQAIIRVFYFIIVILIVYLLIFNIEILYNAIGIRVELMISGFLGNETDASTNTRLLYAIHALEVFVDNPVLGIGQDSFRYINPYTFTYSHCNFTELLANLGLIGFMIYYSLFLFIFYNLRKYSKSKFSRILIYTVLIVSFASVNYSDELVAIIIGIVLGNLNLLYMRKDEFI